MLRDTTTSALALRYASFVDVLGGGAALESTEFVAARAGLVTLHAVDQYLADGAVSPQMLGAAQDAIRAVRHDDEERRLLEQIVARVSEAGPVRLERFGFWIFGYARCLQVRRRWACAADVYATLVAGLASCLRHDPTADYDLAARAALSLGACRRLSGDLDGAAAAYTEAGAIGMYLREDMIQWKAKLGAAKVTCQRGNLPAAHEQVEAIIAGTIRQRLQPVRAEAFHELGVVLYRRGQSTQAIQAYYESQTLTDSATERHRVLLDMATAMTECGYLEQAEETLLLVHATTVEAEVRAAAAISLMDVGRMTGREVMFHEYRRVVEREYGSLPPTHQAEFLYWFGAGLDAFDAPVERVLDAYDRSMAVARQHRLAEAQMRADMARTEVANRVAPVRRPLTAPPVVATPPAAVVHVAQILRNERVSAPAGAAASGNDW